MYCKLTPWMERLVKNVDDILGTKTEKYGDFIEINELIGLIDDLYEELSYVKEQFEDFKKDVEDNYKHVSVQEQIEGCD